MSEELKNDFHQAMLDIYNSALKINPPYKATVFLRMVQEHGGKVAADRLLATTVPSQGFTELCLRGKENLKISVEYLVLKKPWRSLFTEQQLAVARKRLKELEVSPPPEDSQQS